MTNYTPAQLQDARVYAASIHRRCADKCLLPDFGFAPHVTMGDKLAYQQKELAMADEIESGVHDQNFTVAQRMDYFLTGECKALLP